MSETAVIITTLNEAGTIGQLVRDLLGRDCGVLVSDGGSTDGTPLLAYDAGADVLVTHHRLPIRDSVLAGFEWALNGDYSRFVVMDAGGSHRIDDLEYLLSVNADVVIGSRFVTGAKYYGRFWRALLSRLASVLCNFAQPGAHFRDWTSGFRVYSRRAVNVIIKNHYRTSMHTWQIETLARLGEAGLTIQEFPITYHAGKSSFSLSTIADAFYVWLHLFNHIGWRKQAEELA